jgi:hypothetical protein
MSICQTNPKENYMKLTRILAIAAASASLMLLNVGPAAAADDTSQVSVSAGSLAFNTAPDVPSLGSLTLNGTAQTKTAAMNAYEVDDATGSGSGWNMNVIGDSAAGKSAVLKEYCTDALATCSTNGVGYVTTSPKTLAANSLTLSSTGASFTAQGGTTGTAPTHSCASACNVDSAGAVIVASAAANAGMGTYQASGYGASSLSLAVPTTTKALASNKVYRVDLVWTLASGPS